MKKILIIAGGREFNDYKLLCETMEDFLETYTDIDIDFVIGGGARGADALGKRWAEHKGYKYITIPAEWETFGKKAGHIRNWKMATMGHVLIAFWDGKSAGTRGMVRDAKTNGLLTYVVRYGEDDDQQLCL